MNHAPQNVKEAAQEVRKHLETLAPGLIKEDRNHRLWTIKCRLFSEIVPIVSTSKMPFKDICIFFEKALTQTTPEIKSMMELPASIMVKEMVLRMQEGPLPNDLFCKIAHFLDARQRHSKSEPAIFHGFLDHTKWPHPDTFKFHPDITKTLTTLSYMIDDPCFGYDFTQTFCFGILPRLSPESRAAFRAGAIISEDDYDFTMDLMADAFTAAFIQLLPPSYPNMTLLLGKVLANFDTLNPQFQNTLDADIANVIIETPKTLLQKVRTERPERYPLIRFCIDGTRPGPDYIPGNLSDKLASSLATSFLSVNQLPEPLGYLFKNPPHSADIHPMITTHVGLVSPYISSKIFEKEFRKITDITIAMTTLTQMTTCCDDKTRNAHSNAIEKYAITAEVSFRLLCTGNEIPTPLLPAAIAHGCRDSAALDTLMSHFIAAQPPQRDILARHISPVCKAWLSEKKTDTT